MPSTTTPDDAFVVDVADLHQRDPVSPYQGRALAGVVRGTWLRGVQIAGAGAESPEPRGRLLNRGVNGGDA
ncbi:hypothetical protein [Streptomyces winkii]|uniref:hypothetical protein n=1 Tax=Streptomyces winkii TaxID=3051178 RepID=UPI0028D13850|nr:hypothetical protein [Streptomyces sp. DSM 40971]